MGSIRPSQSRIVNSRLLGVLNKMGSILITLNILNLICLLGVLNKMGSIPQILWLCLVISLLGVLNKMGSILNHTEEKANQRFARCVKQDGFYTVVLLNKDEGMFARCVKQDGFYTAF